MTIEVRPALPGEVERFLGRPPEHDVVALVGVSGGEIVGVGGLAYTDDGEVFAWCDLRPEARVYRIALHRAARQVLAAARAAGHELVLALPSVVYPRASLWLRRLGAEVVGERGGRELYAWRF